MFHSALFFSWHKFECWFDQWAQVNAYFVTHTIMARHSASVDTFCLIVLFSSLHCTLSAISSLMHVQCSNLQCFKCLHSPPIQFEKSNCQRSVDWRMGMKANLFFWFCQFRFGWKADLSQRTRNKCCSNLVQPMAARSGAKQALVLVSV